MKLKMVQTVLPVFTPNGGGQTGHFLRDNAFDLYLEGGVIRVRIKDKKDGDTYEIPMGNVAVYQRAPEAAPDTQAQGQKR